MALVILSAAWLAVASYLIGRAFRQRRLLQVIDPHALPTGLALQRPCEIAVIVPARNEAANVRSCLEGLLRQDYPASSFRIIVVDDQSTDETASIVASVIAQRDVREPPVALMHAPCLPPGWTGKSHACWLGAKAAIGRGHASARLAEPATGREQSSREGPAWLCFIDADVRPEIPLLSSSVHVASAHGLDLLSLAPRQELGSFAERLILPCGLFLLAFRQDLQRKQGHIASDEVSATGQFMLVRRSVYDEVGGHETVRSEICEDLELARLVKRCGFKVSLCGGANIVSTRMYTGWTTLWPGLAKNVVDTLGGPLAAAVTALVAAALAWSALLLPAFDLYGCIHSWEGACLASAMAVPASMAVLALHVAGTHYFRIPIWYALLFPLAYTIGAAIALDSIRWRVLGRIYWKDRVYSPHAPVSMPHTAQRSPCGGGTDGLH